MLLTSTLLNFYSLLFFMLNAKKQMLLGQRQNIFKLSFRPRTHGNVFLRFCIVSSNELVVLDSLENSKQYKNAGKRFRLYGALDYVYTGPDEFGTVHQFVRFGLAFTRNPRKRTNSSMVSRTNWRTKKNKSSFKPERFRIRPVPCKH